MGHNFVTTASPMPILLDSLPMPTRNFFHFFDREHGRRFVLHNRAFSSGGGGVFFEGISPSRYACARSLDKVYVPLPTYSDFRRRWWSAPYLARVRSLALNGPCVGGRTLRNTRGYFLFLCATFLTRGAAWVGVENGGERQWEGGL